MNSQVTSGVTPSSPLFKSVTKETASSSRDESNTHIYLVPANNNHK